MLRALIPVSMAGLEGSSWEGKRSPDSSGSQGLDPNMPSLIAGRPGVGLFRFLGLSLGLGEETVRDGYRDGKAA